MLQVVTLIFIMAFDHVSLLGDDVNVIGLLYPTETGALHWLLSLAGPGEKGNASVLMVLLVVVVVVASTASLLPPLLSVDALSSLLPTWTTFSPVFTHLFLLYVTSSLPPRLSVTLSWRQDRRMLERRMAELEEELKVRRDESYRGRRHFACFCLISLALACAGSSVVEAHCRVVLYSTPSLDLFSGWVIIVFCYMWLIWLFFYINWCFCFPTEQLTRTHLISAPS